LCGIRLQRGRSIFPLIGAEASETAPYPWNPQLRRQDNLTTEPPHAPFRGSWHRTSRQGPNFWGLAASNIFVQRPRFSGFGIEPLASRGPIFGVPGSELYRHYPGSYEVGLENISQVQQSRDLSHKSRSPRPANNLPLHVMLPVHSTRPGNSTMRRSRCSSRYVSCFFLNAFT
jgi:hypothetical protein